MRIETMDLNFQGAEEVTASFLLLGDKSTALIETGPTTCLEHLMNDLEEHNVSLEDVHQVFLTHLHLDHAGASGHLAELLPNAIFYVHEAGYPHMVDPSKLLKSAARVYGAKMDRLWGTMRPVPKDRLISLKGGEEIEAAGVVLIAHYTPGHAYHHLAYLQPESGALFTGDVAGIRLPGLSHVRPPTSPPDLDVETWKESIKSIRKLAPVNVWLTHFGCFDDVGQHLEVLERRLEDWLWFVEELVDEGKTQDEVTEELSAKADAELSAEGGGPTEADRYRLAGESWVFAAGLWHNATSE
jgi:glyoxylase-like metal-dependent hydrolase (beta-lactamase superfamily II)